tara:strand:- start:13606 stop:14619 length:1014 start_codon:yes stop_codon:yes gene_type:complete
MKEGILKILISTSLLTFFSFPTLAADSKSLNLESSTTQATISLYERVFAKINNVLLSEALFREFVYQQNRSSFYHGKPPEGEEISFYRKSGDKLIEYYLIAQVAKANGIKVNEQEIAQKIADYDAQFVDNEQWKISRVDFLSMYRQLLEINDLADKYQVFIKDAITLSKEQVQTYHAEHMEKFTQPPQNHVAVIMMNVTPSAGGFVWQAVQQQAEEIYEKLQQGAKFSDLAELHSTDVTADNGGDMGFIHQGMTAKKVENLLATMQAGEVTKPLVLLDGIAIFKLVERKPEIAHAFNEVEERAGLLALADARDAAWTKEIMELKEQVQITVNESVFE